MPLKRENNQISGILTNISGMPIKSISIKKSPKNKEITQRQTPR